MSVSKETTVCVITPEPLGYSQSFIQAHLDRLSFTVRHLHGRLDTGFTEGDRPLMARPERLARRGIQEILGSNEPVHTRPLRAYLRRHGVKVVLAEYGPTAVHVLPACREEGIPLVAHFHGYDAYHKEFLERYAAGYADVFGYARALVAVSQNMVEQLAGLEAPKEKIRLNPYGVDLTEFKAGDPAKMPPHFLAIGRFVDKKAPHLTLLAFQKVRSAAPDARLTMMGDGPLWEACRNLVVSSGMSDVVDLRGPCSHAQVAEAMQAARVFVQHSLRPANGDSEGLPVAILEAGASGLPVVATRHAGIPDAVIENETGLLVDEKDVEAMSEAMLRLARDAELAGRLGRAARSRVETHYDMRKSIVGLERILAEAAR